MKRLQMLEKLAKYEEGETYAPRPAEFEVIDELEDLGFVELVDADYNFGSLYKLTHAGFDYLENQTAESKLLTADSLSYL